MILISSVLPEYKICAFWWLHLLYSAHLLSSSALLVKLFLYITAWNYYKSSLDGSYWIQKNLMISNAGSQLSFLRNLVKFCCLIRSKQKLHKNKKVLILAFAFSLTQQSCKQWICCTNRLHWTIYCLRLLYCISNSISNDGLGCIFCITVLYTWYMYRCIHRRSS